MITDFVNRQEELRYLDSAYQSERFEFVVIYGRRRVGKTELVKRFMEGKKAIYFLATATTKLDNIRRFKEASKNMVDLGHIMDDWEAIFRYLAENVKERLLVIIDEFPYLIESEKGLTSKFQAIVDLYLNNTKIFLIFLGSSVSIMEKELLSYKSPLYGRRTGQIKLQPLSFIDAMELLKKDSEETVKIYGVTDGIPAYLREFKENMGFWELVHEKVLRPGSYLREEPLFILRQEFREPSTYMSIMEAIALGHRRVGEIINFCGFRDKTGISPYLRNLEFSGYIVKEKPLLSKMKKGYLYRLSDNFFNFYFRFIYPNLSELEIDELHLLERIKKEYDPYLGLTFEGIAREVLIEFNRRGLLPFKFAKIGRWWHRGREIDAVALNEDTGEILFLEVKWSDLSEREVKSILRELKEKSKYVEWYKKDKGYFGIFAKRIENKVELSKNLGALLFDLGDISSLK